MSWRITLSFALLLNLAAVASAQRVITLNPANVVGDVVQVGPRGVMVKAGDGRNWTLNLGNNTVVRIKGTAVPEMISPRVCVRFAASIDKHTGKAQDKIDKITLFTPVDGIPSRTLGVERAAAGAAADDDDDAAGPPMPPFGPGGGGGLGPGMGPGAGPGQMPRGGRGQRQLPGQGADAPLGPGGPLDAGDGTSGGKSPKRRGNAAKAAADAVPDVDSYEVCAQVVSFHGRRLVANVQNRYVKSRILAELSPDAEIDVDLSDLSLVKVGDKVSAKGWYVTPGVCVQTNKLTVTLANPVAPPGSHPHPRRTPAKDSETPHRAPNKAKHAPAEAAEPPAGDEPAADRPPAHRRAAEPPKEKDENPVVDEPAPKSEEPKAEEPAPEETKPAPKPKTPKKKTPEDDEKDIFEK